MLAPAATSRAATSHWRPSFPAGGSHQPWIAHPKGGELYFSSLSFVTRALSELHEDRGSFSKDIIPPDVRMGEVGST
jgi:hypothetical protein